jgi:hypothetical protein
MANQRRNRNGGNNLASQSGENVNAINNGINSLSMDVK